MVNDVKKHLFSLKNEFTWSWYGVLAATGGRRPDSGRFRQTPKIWSLPVNIWVWLFSEKAKPFRITPFYPTKSALFPLIVERSGKIKTTEFWQQFVVNGLGWAGFGRRSKFDFWHVLKILKCKQPFIDWKGLEIRDPFSPFWVGFRRFVTLLAHFGSESGLKVCLLGLLPSIFWKNVIVLFSILTIFIDYVEAGDYFNW